MKQPVWSYYALLMFPAWSARTFLLGVMDTLEVKRPAMRLDKYKSTVCLHEAMVVPYATAADAVFRLLASVSGQDRTPHPKC